MGGRFGDAAAAWCTLLTRINVNKWLKPIFHVIASWLVVVCVCACTVVVACVAFTTAENCHMHYGVLMATNSTLSHKICGSEKVLIFTMYVEACSSADYYLFYSTFLLDASYWLACGVVEHLAVCKE